MFKADIPFHRDDAQRFLPWIIALMSGLVALMLCTAMTLNQWSGAHTANYNSQITIHIPNKENASDKADDIVRSTLKALNTSGLVTHATRVEQKDMLNLLEPWLGDDETLKELPLPVLVEAELKLGETPEETQASLVKIETMLHAVSESIEVHSYAGWVEKFGQFSYILQIIVAALIICILGSLAAMIIFVSRATMKLHAKSVLLLHSIGADDPYIAKQFQYNALKMALRGAIPGIIVSGLLYLLLDIFVTRLNAPMIPSLHFSYGHIIMLLLLPVLAGIIALFSARFAAMKQLRILP